MRGRTDEGIGLLPGGTEDGLTLALVGGGSDGPPPMVFREYLA